MRQAHPLTDTWCEADEMSALGQKRTWYRACVMSVLPLKADIRQCELHVRYVPTADVRPGSVDLH